MTRDDVEVDAVRHGDQVAVYERGESSTLITADIDDLLKDPDARVNREQ